MEEDIEKQADNEYREQVVDPVVDKGLDEQDELEQEQSPEVKGEVTETIELKCADCGYHWKPKLDESMVLYRGKWWHGFCLLKEYRKKYGWKGQANHDENGNPIAWL